MACIYRWNARFSNYYSLLLENNPEKNKKDESVTGGWCQFLLITINNTKKKTIKSISPVLLLVVRLEGLLFGNAPT